MDGKKAEIPLHTSKGAQNGAFRSSADLGARVRKGALIVQRLHREHCQYHSMKGKMILRRKMLEVHLDKFVCTFLHVCI